jgi:hypothetical protein
VENSGRGTKQPGERLVSRDVSRGGEERKDFAQHNGEVKNHMGELRWKRGRKKYSQLTYKGEGQTI